MAKVIDYVVKYYDKENPEGVIKTSGSEVSALMHMALWLATDELQKLFSFGKKVTIYPHQDKRWAELNGVPQTGYTIEVEGNTISWNIEPRVREPKPRRWLGETEYKEAKSQKYYRDRDEDKKRHKVA